MTEKGRGEGHPFWGCTLDGVYVPGTYLHSMFVLPYATQVFVVVFVSRL